MPLPPVRETELDLERREHELTLHIFAISAGLLGVCLTGIGLLRVLSSHRQAQTLGEELLAANALIFVLCCVLSFCSFKMRHARRRRLVRQVVDGLFLLALLFMVAVCVLVAWAVV